MGDQVHGPECYVEVGEGGDDQGGEDPWVVEPPEHRQVPWGLPN
jgi:hypothetical protein